MSSHSKTQTPPSMPPAPLATFPGEITGNTPGWQYLASEAGKMVHVPFEGRYESKGGRIQSTWIPLDKDPCQPAFYRLTFTARTSAQCYWWVDFQDASGQALPDVNSAVYPGQDERGYDQMLYVMGSAASLRLAFQSEAGVVVRDIQVRRVSADIAAQWNDRLRDTLPPLRFTPPDDAFARLPKTANALAHGLPWRIVMLGDSIQNDSFNSVFQALVARDFPQSQLDFVISVRGATGCWHYQHPGNFHDYVARYNPDLLLIGGISNDNPEAGSFAENLEAIRRVVAQAHALGSEIALLSAPHSGDWRPLHSTDPDADLAPQEWTEETLVPRGSPKLRWRPYAKLAEECGIAFWNLTVPTADFVAASCKPHGWFNRDYIHNNDRGKQLIGRVLQQFFLTARTAATHRPT